MVREAIDLARVHKGSRVFMTGDGCENAEAEYESARVVRSHLRCLNVPKERKSKL